MRDPLIVKSSIVLLGLLTLAQILITVVLKFNPNKDLTEVKVRTRSWWIMISLLEIALYFGRGTIVGFFGLLSFFSLREFLSRIPTRKCDRRILFWLFFAIPIQFYFVYHQMLIPFLSFIPLLGICFVGPRLLLTGQPKGFVLALSVFQLGLLATVFSIGHIAYLPLIVKSRYTIMAGPLLFFVCITQANDVFQFLSGKTFGKQKIMPLISPKKTVEGFLGGILLSTVAAAIVGPFLTTLNIFEAGFAGALLSFFGFFGDVFMSAFKRDLGIKDFSQIIPGHGGILDRIDSLVISAPLFFHLFRYFSKGA